MSKNLMNIWGNILNFIHVSNQRSSMEVNTLRSFYLHGLCIKGCISTEKNIKDLIFKSILLVQTAKYLSIRKSCKVYINFLGDDCCKSIVESISSNNGHDRRVTIN